MPSSRLGLYLSCAFALLSASYVGACDDNGDAASEKATGGSAAGSDHSGGAAARAGSTPTGGSAGGGSARDGGSGGEAGSGGPVADPCHIDLPSFENNGYRICPMNDGSAVAGECWPQVHGEFGSREVCGNYRIYWFGHDGRIGCAYDSTSGDLAGGFLDGLPSKAPTSCLVVFAGPLDLAACAPESPSLAQPWCGDDPNTSGASGGDAGTGPLGGAAGGSALGGAAGQP